MVIRMLFHNTVVTFQIGITVIKCSSLDYTTCTLEGYFMREPKLRSCGIFIRLLKFDALSQGKLRSKVYCATNRRDRLFYLVCLRMYCCHEVLPDSLPPPVSFSPPKAPPISAPFVGIFTLTIPQSDPFGLKI